MFETRFPTSCRRLADARRLALAFLLTGCPFSQGQTSPVAGGEYFFGVDPGQGLGTSIAAPAAVGVPSLITVPVAAVGALPAGVHTFSLRWKDGDNAWGVPATTRIYKLPSDEFTATALSGMEYYVDTDPGQGQGTAVTLPTGNASVLRAFTVPPEAVATAATGVHTLSVRYRDARGAWSAPATTLFVKSPAEFSPATLTAAETFFDADPGAGMGFRYAIPGLPASHTGVIPVDAAATQALSTGVHTLSVRYQDSRGVWGAPSTTLIVKSGETVESLKIARFEWEWWIGSNFAGRTAGTPIPVTPALASSEVPVRLSGVQLTAGQTVTIRAWWVAGDGTVGIPAQRSWTVDAHALACNKFHFTPAEVGNAAISGPTADPDRDGTSNLLELALGSDPRQSNGVPFLIKELNTPAAGLTIDFPRIAGGSTDAEGTYTAGKYEYCLEELSFVPGGSSVWKAVPRQDLSLLATPQPATPAFEKATATISIPPGMARRFVRLSVKIVP